MIDAEQIPDKAVEAAFKSFTTGLRETWREELRDAVAAAINAWPGMMFNDAEVIDGDLYPPIIYLVIRQETRDE